MVGIKINRYSPFERGTAHAQVLKSGLDEVVEHFLFSLLGINKGLVVFNEFFQQFLIFRQSEEIRFFLCRFNFSATVGTFSVYKLAFGPKRLTRCAIHTLVCSFVYIALIIELFKYLLYYLFVI